MYVTRGPSLPKSKTKAARKVGKGRSKEEKYILSAKGGKVKKVRKGSKKGIKGGKGKRETILNP